MGTRALDDAECWCLRCRSGGASRSNDGILEIENVIAYALQCKRQACKCLGMKLGVFRFNGYIYLEGSLKPPGRDWCNGDSVKSYDNDLS